MSPAWRISTLYKDAAVYRTYIQYENEGCPYDNDSAFPSPPVHTSRPSSLSTTSQTGGFSSASHEILEPLR
jgi:hypothetical protein